MPYQREASVDIDAQSLLDHVAVILFRAKCQLGSTLVDRATSGTISLDKSQYSRFEIPPSFHFHSRTSSSSRRRLSQSIRVQPLLWQQSPPCSALSFFRSFVRSFFLSLRVLRCQPQSETLRKLNLLADVHTKTRWQKRFY